MCGGCSICSFCKTFQRNAQPSLEVRISRGLGIYPNKSFDEIGAEAEISKTSIPGQECPACQFVTSRFISFDEAYIELCLTEKFPMHILLHLTMLLEWSNAYQRYWFFAFHL